MRDQDIRTKQEIDKRNRLIQENQERFNLWRVNNETRVLCASREFAEGVGRIAVVSVQESKAGVVHRKIR